MEPSGGAGTARATWFGPEDRPLFGWLHVPPGGRARAGVVLCPPIGYEYVCAHRTFRVLAERLAAVGLVTLRFDYDGTGDAAGDDTDPGRRTAWLRSIDDAVALLRQAGAARVGLVGMRLGATLAANASIDVDALVLWDPVLSGRNFVRQLRALQLLGVGADAEEAGDRESLAVAGTIFSPSTLAELSALQVPVLRRPDVPVLVLRRPDGLDGAALPPAATVVEAVGQGALLDGPSSTASVPAAAVETIATWLAEELVGEAVAIDPPVRLEAEVGAGVTERLMHLGELGLFGVSSEGQLDPSAPTVVLLNNATDHHVGPSRLWTHWGRELARSGFPVLRVDLSGIGDSPARPGQALDRSYAAEAIDDVRAIIRHIDRGTGVVLVGLCSGGRHALDAAALLDGVRGVCSINASVHLPAEVLQLISIEDPVPSPVAARNRYRPVQSRLLRMVPGIVWSVLDRVGVVRSRTRLLEDVRASGVDLLLVYGEDDFGLRKLRETAAAALGRLVGQPGCRLVTVPDLDHALMAPTARRETMRIITDHLIDRFLVAGGDHVLVPGRRCASPS
ncbi:MAG: alpha/beta hydrolase [Acidobacteria bacterium]|nr:alpha/beta hydrolase [Acidobacteriota bacterium]